MANQKKHRHMGGGDGNYSAERKEHPSRQEIKDKTRRFQAKGTTGTLEYVEEKEEQNVKVKRKKKKERH